MNYLPEPHEHHTCPGGCGTLVSNQFACRPCWRRLPMAYQTPILTSRWAGDWDAHSRALSDAMGWYTLDSDRRWAGAIRSMQ